MKIVIDHSDECNWYFYEDDVPDTNTREAYVADVTVYEYNKLLQVFKDFELAQKFLTAKAEETKAKQAAKEFLADLAGVHEE